MDETFDQVAVAARRRLRSVPSAGGDRKGRFPLHAVIVLTTFAVIFVAELPDKSLFASLVLGARMRPSWTWLGVSAAFVTHVVIAVAAGGLLTLLPPRVVTGVVAALFALAAVWMLGGRERRDEPPPAPVPAEVLAAGAFQRAATAGAGGTADERPSGPAEPGAGAGAHTASLVTRSGEMGFVRTFWTGFGVVFVGEWGDVTQIATANLAAKTGHPVAVGVGAALALCSVAGLAVAVGRRVLRRMSVTVVRRIAGMVMAVLALISLVQLVRG